MNRVKKILYLGWLGQGNVGDDVLFEVFKSLFYQNIDRKHYKYEYDIDSVYYETGYKTNIRDYDLVVLGGGSLFGLNYWLDRCQEAQGYGIPTTSWGTGIDGFYTSKEDLTGIVHVFTENQKKQLLDVAKKMIYVSIRGPYTKELMVSTGVGANLIHEVGDPALLYENQWANALPEDKQKIVVNWGTSNNNIFGTDEERVEEQLEIVIQILLNRGYSISLYPIWTKDIAHVKKLGSKFTEGKLTIIDEVYDAKGLVNFIGKHYFSINMKLHANILSAAMNRPFISLAYRGKCFDFAESVGCRDLTVSTAEVHAGMILERVDYIGREYGRIVKRFEAAKEKYRPRLIDSLKAIIKILEG